MVDSRFFQDPPNCLFRQRLGAKVGTVSLLRMELEGRAVPDAGLHVEQIPGIVSLPYGNDYSTKIWMAGSWTSRRTGSVGDSATRLDLPHVRDAISEVEAHSAS